MPFVRALYHLYPDGEGSWGYGTILSDDSVPNIVSFGEDNEASKNENTDRYIKKEMHSSREIEDFVETPLFFAS